MTTNTPPTLDARPIAELEAELSAAQAAVDAAVTALDAAKDQRDKASAALRAARLAADAALPGATIIRRDKAEGRVVISRRTKTTIFTRRPGDNSEQAWRESKYTPGQWNEHPRRSSAWTDGRTLRLETKE